MGVHDDQRSTPAAPETGVGVRAQRHVLGVEPVAQAELHGSSQHQVGRVGLLLEHTARTLRTQQPFTKGFATARGEIICWLNSDDQYLPGTFEIVRREFSKPEVDVIFGDCEEDLCDGSPARIRKARFERREDFLVWWEKRT
ncbi:MAG: glycosyltransferase, partial [Gammaproteobacteria bacterium]|nr:glycosyltransferase [Gammaproteobacteria bacterium]